MDRLFGLVGSMDCKDDSMDCMYIDRMDYNQMHLLDHPRILLIQLVDAVEAVEAVAAVASVVVAVVVEVIVVAVVIVLGLVSGVVG